MWSKPAPSTDWPMRETIYDAHDTSTSVGKLLIRKHAYERAERGHLYFHAFGLAVLRDAGAGFVWSGPASHPEAIPVVKAAGGIGQITVRVDYTAEQYWRWTVEDAYSLLRCRTFPKAVWVI